MRLQAALLLIGILAFGMFATDTEGRYIDLSIGRELCGKSAAENGSDSWLSGLVRLTCDLDEALLWMRDNDDEEHARSSALRHHK